MTEAGNTVGTEAEGALFGKVAFTLAIAVGLLSVGLGTYFGLSGHSGTSHSVQSVILPAPSERSIFFPTTVLDFGKMRPGDRKEVIARFQNRGSAPLLVRKARSTCACVIASLVDNELKSGQEGQLKVLLIAEAKHGKVEYPVYVESDDPKQPFVKMGVVVTVDSGVWAEPRSIDLGKIPKGGGFRQFVRLGRKDAGMTVTGAQSSSSAVSVELVQGKDFGFVVSGNAGHELGPFDEKIGLIARESRTPILYIPLKGEVVP